MKILIITYYWPPAGGSGVQRWLKFVKYLQDFGVTPVIYTVENPDYPILDDSLQEDIPEGIEVIKQPIWEPNHLLSKFSKKNKGVSAGFLGKSKSLPSKLLTYIRANYFIPDARKFWIKPSIKFLTNYLKQNPVEAIITTGPPHSMHMIGLGVKQKLNIKWIADFRDPWTDIDYFHQLPLSKRSLEKHKQLEKGVLQKADKVIVVGETMKQTYLPFNINTTVITNGFDGAISNEHNVDDEFTITHIGMLNADRNPLILWKVLSKLSEQIPFKIRLIGKVAEEVIESITSFGLIEKIERVAYVPHKDIKFHQQKSQVLLLAINNVPSAKGIITGKIFEYLQAKRPIIAIGPTDGDLANILQETQAGTILDFEDEEGLQQTILDLFSKFTNNVLEVESKGVEKYHRRALTEQLVHILKS